MLLNMHLLGISYGAGRVRVPIMFKTLSDDGQAYLVNDSDNE